jgi:methionyl-tRNA synthetase
LTGGTATKNLPALHPALKGRWMPDRWIIYCILTRKPCPPQKHWDFRRIWQTEAGQDQTFISKKEVKFFSLLLPARFMQAAFNFTARFLHGKDWTFLMENIL